MNKEKCWNCDDTGVRLVHDPTYENEDNFRKEICDCSLNKGSEKQ